VKERSLEFLEQFRLDGHQDENDMHRDRRVRLNGTDSAGPALR
jgi:hypothetical protein